MLYCFHTAGVLHIKSILNYITKPLTLQTMIFRYNYKSNDVFYSPNSYYKVYLTEIQMDSPGNKLYYCTLMHIICEHLHDLYTLNSLSGWKGLTKIIPRGLLNSTLIYILFSLVKLIWMKRFVSTLGLLLYSLLCL